MSDEPPVLDPAVLAVLESARPLTEAPVAVKARLMSSLELRIGGLPSGGGGDGGAAPGGAGAAGAGWVASHPLIVLGAVFAIGGVAGALVREATLPPPRVVYVDRVVSAPSAVSPVVATPKAAPAAVSVDSLPSARAAAPLLAASAPSSASAPAAPTDSGEHLRAESALLDTARSAVAQGEGERALAAVARHEATFPNGLLREEREALAVKALILAGRGDQAVARGARFRERYPTSVLSPPWIRRSAASRA